MTLKNTLPEIFQQLLSPFSWLFIDRRRRIIFLTICSPILLPLFCLSFPFLCFRHLYICLCRRRRRRRRDDDDLRRCEEGRVEREEDEEDEDEDEYDDEREISWMLLQRYLEDQLGLVLVYDCGDDYDYDYYYYDDDDGGGGGDGDGGDDDDDDDDDDESRPFLV